ncbi:ligase-associated DNA damage response endonuclease PdeM [Maribacter sp. 2307ULW6-5]|uniref:ligase-associated DNA damage response endonuclease PdeM n=1 Tax=Maribacter sp. 2307ULW6-5 TaxID=3386275 RepID=UPI0039BCD9E0
MTHPISIQNQDFVLHASGVLYWAQRGILLISDVHLGKVSHFRKFGAAVPQRAVQRNFDALDAVLSHFTPKTVVFMGDLFHSSLNMEWDLFATWLGRQSADFVLVSGNHDIISPLRYEALDVEVVEELLLDGFLLTHHPEEREGFFNLCGHVHPAVRLTGLGRQSVRLRCFYQLPLQMILPAFGEFTGSHVLEAREGCAIFALLGDAVLPVTLQERKASGRHRK